jgi:hypothetical protein
LLIPNLKPSTQLSLVGQLCLPAPESRLLVQIRTAVNNVGLVGASVTGVSQEASHRGPAMPASASICAMTCFASLRLCVCCLLCVLHVCCVCVARELKRAVCVSVCVCARVRARVCMCVSVHVCMCVSFS